MFWHKSRLRRLSQLASTKRKQEARGCTWHWKAGGMLTAAAIELILWRQSNEILCKQYIILRELQLESRVLEWVNGADGVYSSLNCQGSDGKEALQSTLNFHSANMNGRLDPRIRVKYRRSEEEKSNSLHWWGFSLEFTPIVIWFYSNVSFTDGPHLLSKCWMK